MVKELLINSELWINDVKYRVTECANSDICENCDLRLNQDPNYIGEKRCPVEYEDCMLEYARDRRDKKNVNFKEVK